MVFTRRQSSRLAAQQARDSRAIEEPTNTPKAETSTASAMSTLTESLKESEQNEKPAIEEPRSPRTSRGAFSFFSSITQRTPKNRPSIQPADDEMHPQLHHKTTTTPYDEARWLGFFNMGAHTAPAKTTSVATAAPATPTPVKTKAIVSPEFKFKFKRQSTVELSPEAQKMMAESREEAARIRARMSALPPIPDTEPGEPYAPVEKKDDAAERKIAKPKGKVRRFSAAHMAEFKKMDSIENHPSTWRLNTERFAAVTKSLKRSPSKAELDKSESNPFLSKPPSTATVGFSGMSSSAKRVKQYHADDAAKTRPLFPENKPTPTPTPKLGHTTKSNLPRSLAHLMTPTKASLARSQSVKNLRTTSKLPMPSLVRSKSVKSLRFPPHTPSAQVDGKVSKPASPSPVKVADFKDTPIKVPAALKSPSPSELDSGRSTPQLKSILRTPHRLYSNDPSLIAAGTHLATPPDARRHLPTIPATAPVIKHVDFTASALDKARRDEAKAASVEPELVSYPKLSGEAEDTDSRRSTISSLPIPGSFTFRSGTPIVFASSKPVKKPTIRTVRSSDIGLPSVSKESPSVRYPELSTPGKRKLEFLGQIHEELESEKENCDDRDEDDQPAKKMRKMDASDKKKMVAAPTKHTPRKLVKKSRLPTSANKAGGLSAARLNLLAQPKRRA